MTSGAQIIIHRRNAGRSVDGPAGPAADVLHHSNIPLFHHSIHRPAEGGSGGAIVQNKANFRRAVIGANYFVGKEL